MLLFVSVCFLFFLVMLSNFLTILVVRDKINLKLAPAIPTGAPTTLSKKNNKQTNKQTPPFVALKTIKILSI